MINPFNFVRWAEAQITGGNTVKPAPHTDIPAQVATATAQQPQQATATPAPVDLHSAATAADTAQPEAVNTQASSTTQQQGKSFMNAEMIKLGLSILTITPTLVGDVEAAVSKVQNDPTEAAKLKDILTGVEKIAGALIGVL